MAIFPLAPDQTIARMWSSCRIIWECWCNNNRGFYQRSQLLSSCL